MKKFRSLFVSFVVVVFFFSCQPKENTDTVEIAAIPRLARYYKSDSLDPNGDTVYHKIPCDTFVNQYGEKFTTDTVKGKLSVVQFFFASCEGICPVMSNSMYEVQMEFATNQDVQLVSFTVDPERDSVPALKKYADRFHADSTRWNLITGEKKKIYDMARYGYFLPVEPGNGDSEDFIHSDQLVLVDRHSIIRGYYTGTDSTQVKNLLEDIHVLLKEK